MKLYTSIGPNPRVVNMCIAEKGVDIPTETVDIMAGDNRRAEFLAINPAGQVPALILDSGQLITEIGPICRYLEELYPQPPLFGETPEQRAEVDMWARRIDLQITEPMTIAFRSAEGYEMFKDRCHCIPESADDLKAYGQSGLDWIEKQMAGKTWVCGDRFTYADVLLYCFLDFFSAVNQPLAAHHANLAAFHARAGERPSAAASAFA